MSSATGGCYSDAQLRHHRELKANFCQASEMVAKLFLGQNQSYYNGSQAVVDRVREWAAGEGETLRREDLLRVLADAELPPSAQHPQKEQTTFGRKRAEPGSWGDMAPMGSSAAASPTHSFSHSPRSSSPPTKRFASAAVVGNAARGLSIS